MHSLIPYLDHTAEHQPEPRRADRINKAAQSCHTLCRFQQTRLKNIGVYFTSAMLSARIRREGLFEKW